MIPRLSALALSALLLLAACDNESAPAVAMSEENRFEPESLTVAPGTEVVFTNDSESAHSVTAYENRIPEGVEYVSSGGFESEREAREGLSEALIAPGDEYSVTLDEPGTYEYFCIPHEELGMKATIVVEG